MQHCEFHGSLRNGPTWRCCESDVRMSGLRGRLGRCGGRETEKWYFCSEKVGFTPECNTLEIVALNEGSTYVFSGPCLPPANMGGKAW